MKKIIVFVVLIGAFTLTVKAYAEPYSKIIRNDGVEINKCIDDYGRIDFCSSQDRMSFDAIGRYPNKFWITEEISVQKKVNNISFAQQCRNGEYAVSSATSLVNSIFNAIDMFRRR